MLCNKKRILFILSALTLLLSIVLLLKKESNDQFSLKSYRNTIALYSGNEVIKIYDNIVLNTLPEQDKEHFSNGVYIESVIAAEEYLADFDG